MTVDYDQWQALANDAQYNNRQIADFEYWQASKNNQFWSFYDWFRECSSSSGAVQCGGRNYDFYFDDQFGSQFNRIELRSEEFGGKLGDSETLYTKLVAPTDHPCGCDIAPKTYTNGEVLILHWDWQRTLRDYLFPMCAPGKILYRYMHTQNASNFPNTMQCNIDTAWTAIKNSGAVAVVLIGQTDYWSTLQVPSSDDGTGPAVFQVKSTWGQILFAAVAKQFFLLRQSFYQEPTEFAFWKEAYDRPYYTYYYNYAPFHTNYGDFAYDGVWGDEFLEIEFGQVEHARLSQTSSRGPTYDLR
jgi:hypothetical protein